MTYSAYQTGHHPQRKAQSHYDAVACMQQHLVCVFGVCLAFHLADLLVHEINSF